ncbi:hypothetical protein BUALT_Bualt11G0029600 [Buddleja alternifolia]|uniref:Uncharacterized protein n=1 Tax=Buddleja alternifolia TaxID=168488 RepID=A0AAV6WX13_9LAMI|nr:hypothetical protein BUALT_Bualt11G0029600 [Buddleja alternifolia]
MEIDFLGLNSSSKYSKMEQKASNNHEFTDLDNQGVETFLSLSTSSSLNHSKKKAWGYGLPSCSSSSNSTLSSFAYYKREHVLNKGQPPNLVLVPKAIYPSSTTGFRYNPNDKSTNLRNISQIPCRINVYNGTLPEKATNTIYVAGNVSREPSSDARKCSRGYTPTVAMARRATLARFLEKRLHRMNQAKASHFMGKSMIATNCESCDTSIVRCNKRKNNGKHEQRLQ